LIPVWNDKEYWNKRYQLEQKDRPQFDWYEDFNAFKEILLKYISKSDFVLEVGCGNSEVAERLYIEGFKNILSTDFSEVVIEQMSKRMQEKKLDLKFEIMDVREMKLESNSVDIVLDKATSDAIFQDGSEKNRPDFEKMAREVTRVLKDNGKWIIFTRKIPLNWFSNFPYQNIVHEMKENNGTNIYFVYVLLKKT